MKKIIQIEIECPDCDMINIRQSDLMNIQNEVMNQLSIVENVMEGRFEIGAKVVESVKEEELDRLAEDYVDNFSEDIPASIAFKDGYRKALNK